MAFFAPGAATQPRGRRQARVSRSLAQFRDQRRSQRALHPAPQTGRQVTTCDSSSHLDQPTVLPRSISLSLVLQFVCGGAQSHGQGDRLRGGVQDPTDAEPRGRAHDRCVRAHVSLPSLSLSPRRLFNAPLPQTTGRKWPARSPCCSGLVTPTWSATTAPSTTTTLCGYGASAQQLPISDAMMETTS